MPWQLILSAVPVILLLAALVRFEVISNIHEREKDQKEKDILMPLVEKVQQKHKEKYGRMDTDLEREFQEFDQAK